VSSFYIGEIRMFAITKLPSDWLACDGSLVQIASYPQLYTLIGTTYGGDGNSTFALPDMRGRAPIHRGQGPTLGPYALGQSGGVEGVTLTGANLPPHGHGFTVYDDPATTATPDTVSVLGNPDTCAMYMEPGVGTPQQLDPRAITGGGPGGPHNNCMPTRCIGFAIATAGTPPS
jgi:microcystin-dependent protein